MRLYLISLGVGLLVGLGYALLGVRAPAPPVVALVGLLGILLGEQALPVAKRLASGQAIGLPWPRTPSASHVLAEPSAVPKSESADRDP